MLRLVIPATELWDKSKRQFITTKEQTLQLEHSLVSLSKWESKWCKPFLSNKEMTPEESIDYIKCMTLDEDVPDDVYTRIDNRILKEVSAYIEAPMTATYIHEDKRGGVGREIITNELIYYWMVSLQIPSEYENWHLNRLMTLIKVCSIKNSPPKKRSRSEITSQYAALNAARKQKLNTKG